MTTTESSPVAARPAVADEPLDVTIVLPCRNEEHTVATCTTAARTWLALRGLNGEVVVVDNASSDTSAAAALLAGARVVHEPRLGYGTAIRAGLATARGRIIIMADADNTYDLTNLDAFYDPIAIADTHDMVIGDRFAGGITPGAMSRSHHLGNRVLSGATRIVTGIGIRDVHCGLRSFTPTAMADLPAWSTGMEFATHIITHAQAKGLRITQTPTTLRPAAAGRESHLRPLRDGLRHLAAIARTAVR